MAVFAGVTKVRRYVSDPGTDDTLPAQGTLSWGAITTVSAMAGTTGTDATLVHGDGWQQIIGTMTESFTGDVSTTIGQKQNLIVSSDRTEQISGNHVEMVIGNRNDMVIGAHNHVNLGVRNNTYVNPKSEVHSGEKGSEESGSWFKSVGAEGKFITFDLTIAVSKVEVVIALAFEMIKWGVELGLIKGEAWAFKKETNGCKDEEVALDNKLKAVDSHIKALDTRVGALEPKAVACVATAGADPNATPMI